MDIEDYDKWKLETSPALKPWDEQKYLLMCPSCKEEGYYEDFYNPIERICKFCGKKFKG
jgi:uncharacterized protein (DUF983 family)